MIPKKVFNHEMSDWYTISATDTDQIQLLSDEFGIDDEFLAYSLDKNERARVEFDALSNTFLLIYNVAQQRKVENHYESTPMTFMVKDNHLFTIVSQNTEYIVPMIEKLINNDPEISLYNLVFSTLFLIADAYFPLVEEVNMERKLVNHRLREKTTNKNLLALSDLEVGLVYLVMASKQNAVLLEQLRIQPVYRRLTAEEKEQHEDALIEAKQLVEMTQLASQILQQLSGAYNNVLNNNLNDTMRFLTVWSLLLTIPTIVAGFFGMNMPLPFEHDSLGWIMTIGISVILWFVLAFFIRRRIR
ncbi:MAG: magnesium transporter CorA family protein [Enterococcus sp.]